MRGSIVWLAAWAIVSVPSFGNTSDVRAGEWCLFGRCHSGCGSNCCRHGCCPPACCECEDDDGHCCYGPPPPPGPVVASIPAIMLAQSAMYVPPQRIDLALRAQYQQGDREKIVRQLLQAVEERSRDAAAARGQHAAAPIDAEQVRQLQRDVERLKATTQQLVQLLEEIKQQSAK